MDITIAEHAAIEFGGAERSSKGAQAARAACCAQARPEGHQANSDSSPSSGKLWDADFADTAGCSVKTVTRYRKCWDSVANCPQAHKAEYKGIAASEHLSPEDLPHMLEVAEAIGEEAFRHWHPEQVEKRASNAPQPTVRVIGEPVPPNPASVEFQRRLEEQGESSVVIDDNFDPDNPDDWEPDSEDPDDWEPDSEDLEPWLTKNPDWDTDIKPLVHKVSWVRDDLFDFVDMPWDRMPENKVKVLALLDDLKRAVQEAIDTIGDM